MGLMYQKALQISQYLEKLPPEYFVFTLILVLLLVFSKYKSLKGLLLLASILLSVRYIVWRALFSLNTANEIGLSVSMVLLLAELFGLALYLLFIYQSARTLPEPLPYMPDDSLPSVDIFITVYNEPVDILARTVVGCLFQDYPADRFKVHVLDDGKREVVRKLCAEYGCNYITRPSNEGAKAGNINNAMRHTDGELIVIFDCDHVPVKSFLRETIPYFIDPKVGFVQTPHHFYNPDTFQANLRLENDLVNEQDLFHKTVQPGRDYHNAAFFAGSSGAIRRSALEETGGFDTRTVTEDIFTSIELHSRGYRSVFVNKVLSAGLSPENDQSYLTQKKRWAEGAVQLLMLNNPLFKKGLSPGQRVCYFSSIVYFFHWAPRIVYLVAPLAHLLLGYPALDISMVVLLYFFLPHYAAQISCFNSISGGTRNPFWNDVYETLMCFSLAKITLRTIISPRKRAFKVTPKGLSSTKSAVQFSVILPHLVLLFLLMAGLVSGSYAIMKGPRDIGLFLISMGWCLYNTVVVLAAVMSAVEKPQYRRAIRLTHRIPVRITMGAEVITAVTRDISEGGLSVFLDRPVPVPGAPVEIVLNPGAEGETSLKGIILREDRDKGGRISLGVRFLDVDARMKAALIRVMFCAEDTWSGAKQVKKAHLTWDSFVVLLSALTKSFIHEKVLRRISPRFSMRFPCRVSFSGMSFEGITRNISFTGFCIEVDGRIDLTNRVTLSVQGADGTEVQIDADVAWQVRNSRGKIICGVSFVSKARAEKLVEVLICKDAA